MIRATAWLALAGLACREAPISLTPEWRLSETPALTSGTEGVTETEFHRVAGAVRLTNAEIAVAMIPPLRGSGPMSSMDPPFSPTGFRRFAVC